MLLNFKMGLEQIQNLFAKQKKLAAQASGEPSLALARFEAAVFPCRGATFCDSCGLVVRRKPFQILFRPEGTKDELGSVTLTKAQGYYKKCLRHKSVPLQNLRVVLVFMNMNLKMPLVQNQITTAASKNHATNSRSTHAIAVQFIVSASSQPLR